MEPIASTSGINSVVSKRYNNIDIELHYLIAKYLSLGPCKKSYDVLKKEIEENKILPSRYDWLGNNHNKTYNDYDNENAHIAADFLYSLVARLGPTMQKLFPTNPLAKNSILGVGTQSLLRSEKDFRREYRSMSQVAVCHRGNNLLEPTTIKRPPNSLHSLVATEQTGSTRLTHFLTDKLYCRLQLFVRNVGHLSAVYCMLFDRRGRYIITGADDMLVKIWSVVDGRLIATLRGASAEISDLAIDHENVLVAAGSCDKIIRVWSLQTLAPVAVLSSHTGMVTALQFCPAPDSEGVLVSTGGDGCVAFWTYSRKKSEIKFDPKPLKLNEKVRPGHSQLICASFSCGGNFLAIGGADHFVRVYCLGGSEGVEKLVEVELHSDRVDSIQWCHSGIGFVSGSRDGVALVWSYQCQEWKTTSLKMTETLPGFTIPEEATKRLQVTMVGWDRTDTYVITASSDHLIRVWNSKTGALKHILKGHEDNAYVIEAHPNNSRLILTAGHDGQLFIWDVISGTEVKSFKNTIEGQGYGALFDAKWAPDGLGIAATDSHGHILIFGIGDDVLYKTIPQELFFHTDYRPLVRDVNHHVLDEQTQLAPHVMPPPFLVNIDGDPYPPDYQRLVPGRENCRDDQLVPNVILNDNGEHEVMDLVVHEMVPGPSEPPIAEQLEPSGNSGPGRPSIDDMIERLEQERRAIVRPTDATESEAGPSGVSPLANGGEWRHASSSHHPDHSYAVASGHGPLSPMAGRVGARREGAIEGVRQSTGNWQRDPNMKWKRRVFVPPLTPSSLDQSVALRTAYGQKELQEYEEEDKKKPEVSVPLGLVSPSLTERENRKYRRRQKRQNHTYSTKETNDTAAKTRRAPSKPASRPSARTQAAFGNDFEDPETIVISNDEESSSSSSSASEVEKEALEEEEEESSSSDENSTDYSDWTADVGVGLEPPKRTVHKQKRHPAKVNRKRKKKKKAEEEEGEIDTDEEPDQEIKKEKERIERVRRKRGADDREKTKEPEEPSFLSLRKRRGRPQVNMAESETGDIDEIPPEFRPPEWLSETVPKKAPYFPQMGDKLMYFRQGHQLYVEAVINRKLYQVDKRTLPWIRKHNLRDQEYVKIIGMKFEIRPPRLCCLKLGILNCDGVPTGDSFTIKYHDTPDVLDFLVLKKTYDTAISRYWTPGARFRCIIDDAWWLGTVESLEPHLPDFPDSVFMCYKVLWDNGERERLSPWDMELIDSQVQLPEAGGSLHVTAQEYKLLVYTPSLEEWNAPSFEEECRRIAEGIGKIMQLSAAEAFLAPVDLNVYPNYAMIVEYPIDLSTIKSRLESHFYRRPNAVQFDVRYVATNAEKFNKKGTAIVKHARVITDLCLRLIKDKSYNDPTLYYHEIQASYYTPTHSEDERKKSRSRRISDSEPETSRGGGRMGARGVASRKGQQKDGTVILPKIDDRPWQLQCKDLLKSMFERQDSAPFRFPVDLERYKDYNQVIDVPMDLTTIREELATGGYQAPVEFAKDVRLVFSNSKTYNTNNKSRIYSMTVRLEAFFEDQIKPIFASWKAKGKTRRGRRRGRPQKLPPQPARQSEPGLSSTLVPSTFQRVATSATIGFKKELDKRIGAGPSGVNSGVTRSSIPSILDPYKGLLSDEEEEVSDEGARGSITEGGKRRSRRVAKLRKRLDDYLDDSDEDYDPKGKPVRTTPMKACPAQAASTPVKCSTSRGASRSSSPKSKGGPVKRSSSRRYEDDSDFEAPPSRRTSSSSSTKAKKSRRYEDDSDYEANIFSPPLGETKQEDIDESRMIRARVGAVARKNLLKSDSSEAEDKGENKELARGRKRKIPSSSSDEDENTLSINGMKKNSKKIDASKKQRVKRETTDSDEEEEEDSKTDSEDSSLQKKGKCLKSRKSQSQTPPRFGKRKQQEESEVEFDEEELENEETDEEEEAEERKSTRRGRVKGIGAGVRRARKVYGKASADEDDDRDEDYIGDFIDDDDASSATSEESSDSDDSDNDRPKRRKKLSSKEKKRLQKEKDIEKKRLSMEKTKAQKAKDRMKQKAQKAREKARAKAKAQRDKEKAKLKKMREKLKLKESKSHSTGTSPKYGRQTVERTNGTNSNFQSCFMSPSTQQFISIYPSPASTSYVPFTPVQMNYSKAIRIQNVTLKGKVIGRKLTPMAPDSGTPGGFGQSATNSYLPSPIIEQPHNVAFMSTSYAPENSGNHFSNDSEEDEIGKRGRIRKKVRYTENDSDEDGLGTVSSRGRMRKANTRMRDFI